MAHTLPYRKIICIAHKFLDFPLELACSICIYMQACTLKRARCTLLFVKKHWVHSKRGGGRAGALWPLCKVIHILPTMGRAGKGVRACHTHEVVPVIRQVHRENSAHSERSSPFKRTFSAPLILAGCVKR